MPKRGGAEAEAPKKRPITDVDDAWDMVDNAEEQDYSGFNKMNTNFFLKKGEKDVEVVFVDKAPIIFNGHTLACKTDAGKEFWTTEACQKITGDHCLMCESRNKNVSKQRKIIAFRLIDSRGSWDSEKGELDGVPAPKIFLAPIYLAKQVKMLKDDVGDDFTDIVFKMSREGKNYTCAPSMKKTGKTYEMKEAPEFDGELPEVMEVYATQEDSNLLEYMERFVINYGSSSSSRDDENGRSSFGK